MNGSVRLFFFLLLMVKQIFFPSFRETLFLLGLFVSSSKQNLHERKINGSLGKICVNIQSKVDLLQFVIQLYTTQIRSAYNCSELVS